MCANNATVGPEFFSKCLKFYGLRQTEPVIMGNHNPGPVRHISRVCDHDIDYFTYEILIFFSDD